MASIPEILFHPDAANNPQEAYARIHSECPVTREADMNGKSTVYLTRYADVMWALKHPEVFSSAPGAVDIGQSQPLILFQHLLFCTPQLSFQRNLFSLAKKSFP